MSRDDLRASFSLFKASSLGFQLDNKFSALKCGSLFQKFHICSFTSLSTLTKLTQPHTTRHRHMSMLPGKTLVTSQTNLYIL